MKKPTELVLALAVSETTDAAGSAAPTTDSPPQPQTPPPLPLPPQAPLAPQRRRLLKSHCLQS